jgi:hypothetical protein
MRNSHEEPESHFGPDSPIGTARKWIWAMLEYGDLREAWTLTDESFRTVLARLWVVANRRHPALTGQQSRKLIEELSKEAPADHLWDDFASSTIADFRRLWSDVDLKRRGWGNKPRPLSPGYERVLLVEAEGELADADKDRVVPSLIFDMRYDEELGWLVAKVGGSELEG